VRVASRCVALTDIAVERLEPFEYCRFSMPSELLAVETVAKSMVDRTPLRPYSSSEEILYKAWSTFSSAPDGIRRK